MLEAAGDIGIIQTAASIGYMFKIDPVQILDDPDIKNWIVRMTAHEYVSKKLQEKKTPPSK